MRPTPFDLHAARANEEGFHNHRVNTHSDILSHGIVTDLREASPALRRDLDEGKVGFWVNRRNPWGRKRNTDLLIAEPLRLKGTVAAPEGSLGLRGAAALGLEPDPSKVRIIGEHKSIVTAHRNRSARHDDLDHLYQDANKNGAGIIACATVMIGVAEWYLNVADGVKGFFDRWETGPEGKRTKVFMKERFEAEFMPRVRAHDRTLMDDFIAAVSENTARDIEASFELFRTLPHRPALQRDHPGFDALLVVPVHYDNVNPARVARDNAFGIDVERAYDRFINRIATDYEALFGKGRPVHVEGPATPLRTRTTGSVGKAPRDI